MNKCVTLVAIVGGLLSSGSTFGDVVFSDNFDGYDPFLSGSTANVDLGLNYTAFNNNWFVNAGTVDLIGQYGATSNFYGISDPSATGRGQFIDLDGSTGQAGTFVSKDLGTLPIGDYKLTFDLAGNLRNLGSSDSLTLVVNVGGVNQVITSAGNQSFETKTIYFHADGTGSTTLSFQEAGGDNQGQLLDNVEVSSVPLPAAVWSGVGTLAGLGAFGVMRRRNLRKA